MRFTLITVLAGAGLVALTNTVGAQVLTDLQPGRNFIGQANFGTFRSENIDVGDADNDGDLDAIVGNGGDGTAQANKIYINSGTGAFTDGSATRFAGLPSDTSRDIEFMDLDNDGDLDVYVSNRGTTTNGGEVSRFHINNAGLQGNPNVGFYVEQTDARWGTLGSVPLSQQVSGGNVGSWRDFSCDCEFADIDDDGDLDLFHSSYGPNINGTEPHRVFTNNGAGVFNELFPWVNASADIRTHALDIDLVDFDGDFDLDIFNSSRDSQARVFMNNLYGTPLGTAPFADITQTALINQGATLTGVNNYEAEPADLDGDGDFDVWAKNYNGNLDRVLRNDGPVAGGWKFTQVNSFIVGDPNVDENEVDFGDYDGDGDLDAFAANFSGTNWIYQSGLAQGFTPAGGLYHRTGGGGSAAAAFPETPTTGGGSTSLDGEWADMDGDGDEDILVANDANQQNYFYRNALGVPDTHAPTFYQLQTVTSPPAGQPVVLHAAVRDNSPYYLFTFYPAVLKYTVNGGAVQTVDAYEQGGQQFRAVIPAQSGTVAYHWEVTDMAGNTGISATNNYTQAGGSPWTNLGFALPGVNGNPSLVGTGPLTTGSAGTLTLSNAAGPGATAILFVSLSSTPAPFKGGTLVPVPILLQLTLFTAGNPGSIPLGWASWPSGLSGQSLYFQYAIADAGAVNGVALSNALRANVP